MPLTFALTDILDMALEGDVAAVSVIVDLVRFIGAIRPDIIDLDNAELQVG